MSFEEAEDAYMMLSIDPESACSCDELHTCQMCIEEESENRAAEELFYQQMNSNNHQSMENVENKSTEQVTARNSRRNENGVWLHRTNEGEIIPVNELETDHLFNIICRQKDLAKQGMKVKLPLITIMQLPDGSESRDVGYKEHTLDKRDALKFLMHDEYQEEYLKRMNV